MGSIEILLFVIGFVWLVRLTQLTAAGVKNGRIEHEQLNAGLRTHWFHITSLALRVGELERKAPEGEK